MEIRHSTYDHIPLREAFNLVGRRIFKDDWTGNEAAGRKATLIDMIPTALLGDNDALVKRYGVSWPDLEKLLKSRPPRLSPKDKAAWDRRNETRWCLEDFVRHGGVKAWIDYDDGTRRIIRPEEWEARRGLLRLYYETGKGKFAVHKGTRPDDIGEVWLDRARLDACLAELTPPEAADSLPRSERYEKWEQRQQKLCFPDGAKKSAMTLRKAAKIIARAEGVDFAHVERETRRVRREREKREQ